MWSATRTCPKCGGTGSRPLLGLLRIRCRTCKGSGVQMKLPARIWGRLRYGPKEDY